MPVFINCKENTILHKCYASNFFFFSLAPENILNTRTALPFPAPPPQPPGPLYTAM